MGIVQTLVLYGLVGAAVATAMLLEGLYSRSPRGALRFAAGVLFWPLFVPALLHSRRASDSRRADDDDLGDPRLTAVRAQLLTSIGALDGALRRLLGPEIQRVSKLTRSLAAMKRRIHEMDRLLEVSPVGEGGAPPRATTAQRRNRARLQRIRDQTEERFRQALVQMEELNSTISLLRFAAGSEEEVVECLRDLAASMEGITEGMLATAPLLE